MLRNLPSRRNDLSLIPLNLPQIMPFNNVMSLSDLPGNLLFIIFVVVPFFLLKVKFLFTTISLNKKNNNNNIIIHPEIENSRFSEKWRRWKSSQSIEFYSLAFDMQILGVNIILLKGVRSGAYYHINRCKHYDAERTNKRTRLELTDCEWR